MVKRLRPDLRVVPLRGNVETRLRKLDDGEADATMLALAGLKRLGLADARDRDPERRRISAGGRAGRHRHRDARERRRARASCSRAINHADTVDRACCRARVPRRARRLLPHADRAAMPRSPAARLHFRGMIVKPDGSEAFETTRDGRSRSDAVKLGADAGRELKRRAGPDFFAALSHAPARHPPASPTASAPPPRCARAATRCCSRRCCASSRSPTPISARRRGRRSCMTSANARARHRRASARGEL